METCFLIFSSDGTIRDFLWNPQIKTVVKVELLADYIPPT